MSEKVRMGMIGGGIGSLIGEDHRKTAQAHGEIALVCGAFSSTRERSLETGRSLQLPDHRIYGDFREMIRAEAELPADERMEFVSIVTPNHLHFQPAKLALENGFHVMIDKPLAFDLTEALTLQALVEETGLQFGITYTYTGYPMVKEARHLVHSGALGKIRKVFAEYPQGWLSEPIEKEGQKQASWRTDPSKSGKSGCMADIGTHVENLVAYITGLEIDRLCADLNAMVIGRELDDDGAALIKFSNGASGVLVATQVAAGEENAMKIRVYGEKGGIEWNHADADTLQVKWLHEPKQVLRLDVDMDALSEAARFNASLPSGHPEGCNLAFANIYRNFACTVRALKNDEQLRDLWFDFPKVEDGVRGMKFIERVVASGSSDQKWIKF